MRSSRVLRHAVHGPWGDASRHLARTDLERGFRALSPPTDVGTLTLIVARGDDGHRETPERAVLTPEGGVPGDAWLRDSPEKLDAQITMMRSDVARLLANGQLLSLFGDNLLVDLDLSVANLPAGSRLRLGRALLEVTPAPGARLHFADDRHSVGFVSQPDDGQQDEMFEFPHQVSGHVASLIATLQN